MEHEQSPAYILDANSGTEMARLIDQDRMVTEAMGGFFPPGFPLTKHERVLDIACGPGGWVRELAFAYPAMSITGIDINRDMIEYASAFASVQHRDSITFEVMDATKPLHFPAESFDIVNARFVAGFLHRDTWPAFLQECRRVCQPGGFLVLTECDEIGRTTSPAFEVLARKGTEAMQRLGYGHHPLGYNVGITPKLGRLLRDAGCGEVHYTASVLEYSAGTRTWHLMYEDITRAYTLGRPFFARMGVATEEELEQLYEAMVMELRELDFCAIWPFMTVWGTVNP